MTRPGPSAERATIFWSIFSIAYRLRYILTPQAGEKSFFGLKPDSISFVRISSFVKSIRTICIRQYIKHWFGYWAYAREFRKAVRNVPKWNHGTDASMYCLLPVSSYIFLYPSSENALIHILTRISECIREFREIQNTGIIFTSIEYISKEQYFF